MFHNNVIHGNNGKGSKKFYVYVHFNIVNNNYGEIGIMIINEKLDSN